jgi:hypothetical protein
MEEFQIAGIDPEEKQQGKQDNESHRPGIVHSLTSRDTAGQEWFLTFIIA